MGTRWLPNVVKFLRQYFCCCGWNGKYTVNPEMNRCKRCCCARRKLLLVMLWINAGLSLALFIHLIVEARNVQESHDITERRDFVVEHRVENVPRPTHETISVGPAIRDDIGPPVVFPQPPHRFPPNHQIPSHPHNHKVVSDSNFRPVVVAGNSEEEYIGAERMQDPYNHRFPGFPAITSTEVWPLPQPELPEITRLEVKCERDLMKVAIEFDRPFFGLIFSKGHYSYEKCVHVPPGLGKQAVYFDILMNTCGTHGDTDHLYGYIRREAGKNGSFFENIIIIQFDPEVQEVWDVARKLRCSWYDQYEKLVSFRPFPVDSLEVLRAEFAGDDVGCWMQIQAGKGPWSSEVSGIVRIGQTMTLVLGVKDSEGAFDMMVRNCIAHDGKRNPIELVSGDGCIVRPKLLSRFTKVKNFGSSASVLSFAHFQAFKFPDSMEVHFQCTVQICRHKCPDQCTISYESPQDGYGNNLARIRREPRSLNDSHKDLKKVAEDEMTEVGLNRVIRVVSDGDLAFSLPDSKDTRKVNISGKTDDVCMPRTKFTVTMVGMFLLVIISGFTSAVLCLCRRKITSDIIAAFNGVLRRKRCG